ncbi:hypothetical protein SBRCBS47491_010243, partial [Sporothrix bragantina]
MGQDAYDETGRRARPWPRDRLARHLRTASASYVGIEFSVAQWRHLAIAITNRYLRALPVDDRRAGLKRKRGSSPYGGYNDNYNDGGGQASSDEDDNDDDYNNPYDAQASHASRTAGLVYGRLLFQGTLGTAHGQERYFRISTSWYNLLRVGTPGSSRTGGTWTFNDDDETEQGRRLQALASTQLETGLAMVARPSACFRGQQAELNRIVYDECHVVLESRASFRPVIQVVFPPVFYANSGPSVDEKEVI